MSIIRLVAKREPCVDTGKGFVKGREKNLSSLYRYIFGNKCFSVLFTVTFLCNRVVEGLKKMSSFLLSSIICILISKLALCSKTKGDKD